MPTVTGIRLGLCLLRYGPQPGLPVVSCYRSHHGIADSKPTHAGKPSSCRMSTVAHKEQTKLFTVDLSQLKEELQIIKHNRCFRKFILDPQLVNDLLYSLDSWHYRSTPIIMEHNPGPGVFTRALLDAGLNVVAMESQRVFLPGLKKLEEKSDGQLKVLHCNIFRQNPRAGSIHAPAMLSSAMMEELGISEVPWDAESALKVFGMLTETRENVLLWQCIYSIFRRQSFFSFGRAELNFLMSEHMYKNLLAKPGDYRTYHALAVLYGIACDIELLYKVNSQYFCFRRLKSSPAVKIEGSSEENICLVRITPRRNTFTENFSSLDTTYFFQMVKQCLVRRKASLLHKLDTILVPGYGEQLLQQMGLPKNTKTGDLYPEEFKLLYEMMNQSEDFNKSFLFDAI